MSWLLIGAMAALCIATNVRAGVSGAIFTTTADGSTVNGNIYKDCCDVYLNGGPVHAKCTAAGLPDGDYYFQVTDPAGSVLLSTDDVSQRRVTVLGGVITAYKGSSSSPCTHLTGVGPCNSVTVQLQPFSSTPNPGGEYKLWMTPVSDYLAGHENDATVNFGFVNSDTKTDNFKCSPTIPPCDPPCYTLVCAAEVDTCNDQGEPYATVLCSDLQGEVMDSSGNVVDATIICMTNGVTLDCSGGSVAFPIGTTEVDCSATVSGNALSCSFNVTVGPCGPAGCQIVCTDITLCNDTGACSGTTNVYVSPNITITTTGGVCDSSTLACTTNDASGNAVSFTGNASFPVGTTPVTCTVTDGAGLQTSCTFNVTVNDCEPPNITCPTPTPQCNDTGVCGAKVSFTVSATDNCDPSPTIVCTNQTGAVVKSGDLFPVGTTTVTCYATDTAQPPNSASCSFSITVNDCEKPVVTCPGPITQCNDTGVCGAKVTFSASATDNCDGTDTVTCTPASGTTFSVGTTTVKCTATDKAGNTGCCSFSVTVNDCEKPVVTCPGDKTVTAGACSTSAKVTFTATATDNCDGTDTVTCTPASGSTFNLGTTTVKCTATDKAGNTGYCCFKVTVNEVTSSGCGGLTMGFWQNKNGQGIITGGAATAGVCNSGTWLRQYAPFQDLSTTATCSQVATYVYNLIKAANASGTSMNAMLKAQMLASALDVYFSDPTLGGNKINAAKPLGGVQLDLTKICKMLDSTSGTGTCSGSYENSSSVFGGSSCMTVSSMLSYAASQSNTGGIIWYGNVKATQGLAKDAFDAFNNGATLICGP